ncbi:RNA deprotection pyrophosphohydrolase [Staphylococcus edaphicus]|uniref:Nucleoside triphosphatase YtkD n=1 Tax=Staphylococcus edaphicus TaxID=1955013 RepID=A0A2C6WJ99_9STAP|nr:nucleoside triphosphatase YtkD [Staphylococcus edaphicus]PHK50848.1 nucleoside triphosphatase YtkD [Staphylococcus edaphicus]UQW82539.1 nucleoside triphosphatase YtkD [Staphylococcus edaphicus]
MYVKFKDRENDDVFLTFKNADEDADGNHVLIIPKYKDQLLFTNHKIRGIEFPGGKKEKGESSENAAVRELLEETGATIKHCEYIAQYKVERQSGLSFTKDVFMVDIEEMIQQSDYFETEGPVLYKSLSEIPEAEKSYLLKDAAILHCLERVIDLGFY